MNENGFAKTAILAVLTTTKTADADFKWMLGKVQIPYPNIFKLLCKSLGFILDFGDVKLLRCAAIWEADFSVKILTKLFEWENHSS